MPFGRFFDRGKSKPANAPEPVDVETPASSEDFDDAETENDDGATEAEALPAEHDDSDWLSRARGVLPTGASTGSKRVEALYGSATATGPTHFQQAVGCRASPAVIRRSEGCRLDGAWARR